MTERIFSIKVVLDTTEAKQAADKFEGSLKGAAAKVKDLGDKAGNSKSSIGGLTTAFNNFKGGPIAAGIGLVGTAIIGAGMAAAQAAAEMAAAVEELTNLARVANTSVQAFQASSFAAANFGVDAKQLSQIVMNVNKQLGAFDTTGKGKFAKFLEALGDQATITSEQLQQLSGPEQLQALVTQLEDANVPMATQIKLLEGMSAGLSKLIPMFANGGAEAEKMASRFKELNGALLPADVEVFATYDDAVANLEAAVGGASSRIMADVAAMATPLVNLLATISSFVAISKAEQAQLKIASAGNSAAQLEEANKQLKIQQDLLKDLQSTSRTAGPGRAGAGGQGRVDEQKAIIEGLKNQIKELEARTEYEEDKARNLAEQNTETRKSNSESASKVINEGLQLELANHQALLVAANQGTEAYEKLAREQKKVADLAKYSADLDKGDVALSSEDKAGLLAKKEAVLDAEYAREDALKRINEKERENAALVSQSKSDAEARAKEEDIRASNRAGFLKGLEDEAALAQLTTEEARTRYGYEKAISEARLTPEQNAQALATMEKIIALNKTAADQAKETSRQEGIRSTVEGLEDQLEVLKAVNEEERQRIEIEQTISDLKATGADAERIRVLNEQIILQKQRNEMLAQEKQAVLDLGRAMGNWASGSKDAIKAVIAQLIQLAAIRAGFGQNSFIGGFLQGVGGSTMRGYAEGGSFNSGETFMVGEKGPEIITSKAPGSVIPNNMLGGGSGGLTQNVSLSINGSIVASEELDRRFQEFAVAVSSSTQNLLRSQLRTGGVLAHGYS